MLAMLSLQQVLYIKHLDKNLVQQCPNGSRKGRNTAGFHSHQAGVSVSTEMFYTETCGVHGGSEILSFCSLFYNSMGTVCENEKKETHWKFLWSFCYAHS